MKRTLILLACVLVAWTGSYGQDVHFSQFNNAPLVTNPALTGAFNAEHRIITNYRQQWGMKLATYRTCAISYDAAFLKGVIPNGFLGAGIQIFYDQAGDLEMGTLQIDGSIAYHLGLNESNFLTAGIQGGYYQRSLNLSNMRWDSQYNPSSPDGFDPTKNSNETMNLKNNYKVGNFSAGLLWTYNNSATNMASNDYIKGNAGIALFHINRPKQGYLDNSAAPDSITKNILPIRTTIHGNFFFGVRNTNMAIVPSMLISIQGKAREILLGSLFRFRLQEKSKYTNFVSETAFSIGAHYRSSIYLVNKEYNGQQYKSFSSDAIIAEAMFDIQNWSIGLSYDINVSKLTSVTKGDGGLEIAIRYMTPIFKKSDKSLY